MVTVFALGRALIDAGGARITPTSTRKFAFLLYLSAENGRRVSRSLLQELIFPDQTDKNARHSLRELSYQIRQIGVCLESDASGIALAPTEVVTDYGALIASERLSVEHLQGAEGGFLPGYSPTHSEAFAEWFDGYRARTTRELCKALLRELAFARASQDWSALERAARACLVFDPLNEEGTLAFAESLAVSGSKAQAVKLLETYMDEIGESSRDLKLPAALLRRRISERMPQQHSSQFNSPFVGREVETARLREYLRRAQSQDAHCVVLTGEPGIGKSRLAAHFCSIAALEGAVVASAATQPNDVYRPFGVFADLMPSLLSLPGSLGCAPEALRILDRLTPRGEHVEIGAKDLAHDNESLCHLIVQAIVELMDAVASEQAIVLAIEDIHWLDTMSLRVLVSLASKKHPRRVLAVLTTRHLEAIEAFSRNAETAVIMDVGPLESAAVGRMTSSLAGLNGVGVDTEMHRWLEDTAGGNPLFLESLFAHFATTGQRFAVSPTLSALVARRLECLTSEAATTLRICALLGKHSTIDAILEAVQLPRFTLLRAVSDLEAARLIRSEGNNIQPAHRLIADIAQRDLAPLTKRMAHQCVAAALESQLALEESTALMWDCAGHWIAANNSNRALSAIWRCAERALEIGRPAETAQVLSWALDLEIQASDQVAVSRQMVLAADAAVEPALVFRGLEILREHGRPPKHDELEFAEFRASARSWYDAPRQQEKLLECIVANDASACHRVTAATWILKHADVQDKPQLAQAAIESLDEEILGCVDDAVRLEYLLMRDCAVGEWNRAAATARELLVTAKATAAPLGLSLQLNASLAFERCGQNAEAIQAAESLYFEAEAKGALRIRIRAAAFLAEQFFDCGDDDMASSWFQRITKLADNIPDMTVDFAPTIARLNHLLTSNDAPAARLLFDRIDRAGLFGGGQLRQRWRQVLVERLRQIEGRLAPSDVFVHCGFDADERTPQMLGIVDFEVATSCHALLEVGNSEAASTIMAEYLAWRSQGRSHLSRCVQNILAELENDALKELRRA